MSPPGRPPATSSVDVSCALQIISDNEGSDQYVKHALHVSCQTPKLFMVVARCWLHKAHAALRNGCEVENRPIGSQPTRLQWVTGQQSRVRSVALEVFLFSLRDRWTPADAAATNVQPHRAFVCEPKLVCAYKVRVLLRSAPCAVVRPTDSRSHNGHVCPCVRRGCRMVEFGHGA